jgi:diketogulonate reductase-like aldo/keto reductase
MNARLTSTTHRSVAIAYVLHKAPFVFPIVGGRKPEQLLANVEALEISLTAEQITYLDGAKPVDLGFPGSLIVRAFPPFPYSSGLVTNDGCGCIG